ncbi:MAG: hypothetical protein CM1200mP2_43360 [Planctomycetaceae bacterium]|nr:MAG: hypothetical protein CM1200mP2_07120 [Planctomycetaceae bacterium]GIS62111.1 MAG: hypothetical protein CM1200mP2_43360 [Planctomycetaceae bacterium]
MWAEAKKARQVKGKRLPSETTYEIREVIRNGRGAVKKGQRVRLSRFRSGKKGDMFLLLGSRAPRSSGAARCRSPRPVTSTSSRLPRRRPPRTSGWSTS